MGSVRYDDEKKVGIRRKEEEINKIK